MKGQREPLESRIHLFVHGGTDGALLKVLDDDPHSLNELLPEAVSYTHLRAHET